MPFGPNGVGGRFSTIEFTEVELRAISGEVLLVPLYTEANCTKVSSPADIPSLLSVPVELK